jgi:hypothetical protein
MLAKLLAGSLLIVLISALATVGVVFYTDYSNPPDVESTPCSHNAPATDDGPACCFPPVTAPTPADPPPCGFALTHPK